MIERSLVRVPLAVDYFELVCPLARHLRCIAPLQAVRAVWRVLCKTAEIVKDIENDIGFSFWLSVLSLR